MHDRPPTPDESPPDLPYLGLRRPLPPVIDTDEGLTQTCAALRAGTGPVAIDAERASGYRYSARAYLVQVRRAGAGTALIDPTAFPSLAPLAGAIADAEWIIHAATQDLPCLREIGLVPTALFDTELAGRLLGYPRVGLATLVEVVLGQRLRKEHSAVDWSTRPLPEPWLEYAALDVEALIELREALAGELDRAGKTDWAEQEFAALLGFTMPQRSDPWRRTSGASRIRNRRQLAAVREMWLTRDEIAAERDIAPGRIVPDSALVVAAQAMPADRYTLLKTKGFHGRGAKRYAKQFAAALDRARELPEDTLPLRSAPSDAPPQPRVWAERDPVAARRLALAREGLATMSAERAVPVENLLAPETVRRVLWHPPDVEEAALPAAVRAVLADWGARPWQIELTAPLLVHAIVAGVA